jgi:glycosyltransferase involved in cell wall biosynthesis
MPRRDDRPHVLMSWFMDDWGRFGRAYEHIAAHLAQSDRIARVLCLLPADWTPMTAWRLPLLVREHRRKLTAIALRPHCAPGYIRPYVLRRALNHRLPRNLPGLIARMLGFSAENTLLWLFPPHRLAEQLHASIPHRAMVAHMIDNNALLTGRSADYRTEAADQYLRLAGAADWVYVNSESNRIRFAVINRHTYHFDNGVDPAFFGTPRFPSSTVRVGYLGWVTERTDVGILEHIAAARPQWQLLIASPATPRACELLRAIRHRRNVVWRTDVDRNTAPDFLASLDVCLMPHANSPYSESMHPLKLLQYLASGRPVVSTGVAGVGDWLDHVRIAADGPGFVRAIEGTLVSDTPAAGQGRIDAVKAQTWDLRVSSMLEPILAGWAESRSGRLPEQLERPPGDLRPADVTPVTLGRTPRQ